MKITSYNPTLPVASMGTVAGINPIQMATLNHQRMDWWDVVSSQLGNRVVDMLKESLYGKSFQPSILKPPPTSDWLRVTLENEIRYAQEQQMSYSKEAAEYDKQIKIAQIYAKSDRFLQEKAQKEAQIQAELAALEQTQMAQEESQQVSFIQPSEHTHTEESLAEAAQLEDPETQEDPEAIKADDDQPNKDNNDGSDDNKLSKEEQQLVNKLAQTDAHIRNHEAAHLGASGGLAKGGANYTYTEGPDGKLYVTAGEVSIDTSSTGDPKKDLQKAKQIQAAALAPSDPSPQDYKVAASAAMMEMKAQMLISEEFSQEVKKEQGMKIYKNNMENVQQAQSSPMAFRIVA